MKFVNEKLQEFNKYVHNKNVAIIGLEASNLPLLDYFCDMGANVTVFDKRTIDEIDKIILDKITQRCIKFSFGKHCLINLIGFDIIFCPTNCRPDLPELKAESIRGAIITSEIEMVLTLCPGKVIGVAGSNGATTTANLIYSILKENGNNCYLEGKFGEPLFTKIKDMNKQSIVVLEFNSVQLMNINHSPEIAVITNVVENKENNIHTSFEECINCNKNLFIHQNETGIVVLNYDNKTTQLFAIEAPGKSRFFSRTNKLDNGVIFDNGIIKYCEDGVRRHILTIDDAISLSGEQNYENICAAISATIGIAEPKIQARAIIKYREM